MALDATVGGASANSYATYDEFTAFWEARPNGTAPLAAEQEDAEAALQWACLLMSAFKWTGTAVDAVQALPWPRSGMLTLTGFPILTTVNPKALKDAQCLFAGDLLANDRAADNPALKVLGTEQALTGLKVGPVSLSFEGTRFSTLEEFDAYVRSLGSDFAYLSKIIPDAVRFLIPPSWYTAATLKRPFLLGAF